MARIRTTKPEFWSSAQVIECSRDARLLFIGLWNFCDDTGRHGDRPKQIKAEVFPADDLNEQDIIKLLDELENNNLILRYTADNEGFFFINGWHHQKIDRPQPSKFPDPFDDHSTIIRRSFVPDRIVKDSKGKEGIVKDSKDGLAPSVGTNPDVEDIFSHWQQVFNHPKAKLDDKRKKVIKARLKDGYTVDDLKTAIDGCRQSPFHMGDNDKNTIYDGLDLILRDGTHVDKFVQIADQPDLSKLSAAGRQTVSAAQSWLRRQDGES